MYVARSPERPSSNVAAIDRYWPKCAKKKYFRRFARASSTSHTHPQMSTRPGSNRPLLCTCHARDRERRHIKRSREEMRPVNVICYRVLYRADLPAERSRSLKMFVKTTIVNGAYKGFHLQKKKKTKKKHVIIKIQKHLTELIASILFESAVPRNWIVLTVLAPYIYLVLSVLLNRVENKNIYNNNVT